MTELTSDDREDSELSRRDFVHAAGATTVLAAGLGVSTVRAATPGGNEPTLAVDYAAQAATPTARAAALD